MDFEINVKTHGFESFGFLIGFSLVVINYRTNNTLF